MVAPKKPQTKAAAEPALYVGARVIPLDPVRSSRSPGSATMALRSSSACVEPSSNAWMASLGAASMPTSPMTST